MAQAKMMFPKDFRWGTATAAHAVEGDNHNNDWWQFEQEQAEIAGQSASGQACNWWQDAESDLDRAAEMGTNAHHLSLEWSRIEPQPSAFDGGALDRYREILQAMHERGIEPLVSLHHFTNPLWLVEKGDFHSEIIDAYFQRYAAQVVEALGDLVSKWCTFNEPITWAYKRYLLGAFPLGSRRGWSAYFTAVANILRCHALAYSTIKEFDDSAQVGLSQQIAIIDTREDQGWMAARWGRRANRYFNDIWLSSIKDGRLRWPAGRKEVPGLAGSCDFIGLNYFSRYYAASWPGRRFFEADWALGDGESTGGDGYGYPYGIYRAIKVALSAEKPIYITANGIPDAQDRVRPAYLMDILRQIWHAISFCYPVMGYYHWSLIDHFSWEEGWQQRYGLIAVDPATQERRMRPSGNLYGEICRTFSLSDDMAARYAPALLPVLFPGESPVAAE